MTYPPQASAIRRGALTIRRGALTIRRQNVLGAVTALLFFVVAANAFAAGGGTQEAVGRTQQAGDEMQEAQPQPQEVSLKDRAAVYFSAHDYDAFYNSLSGLIEKDKTNAAAYFYRALARIEQIAHWKKIKNWEGVYDVGPAYQEGIAADLDAAEKAAQEDATILFGVAFLRWRAAQEKENEEAYGLFDAVVAAAQEAAGSKEGLARIKETADGIKDLEDKNLSRRLYSVYVDYLAGSDMPRETLRKTADDFLDEGNLYLAKSMYAIFLKGIEDDKVRARAMVEIANRFAHPGDAEALDPVYAEELYQRAMDVEGPQAFDQEGVYRRAYNLERLKDYEGALKSYGQWIASYRASDKARAAQVLFREGALAAYGLADTEKAKMFFQDLIDNFSVDPLVVSAQYHLGLLAQGAQEVDAAREHYAAALSLARAGLNEGSEIVALTNARLEELKEGRPMAYGLRLFMEGAFGRDEEAPMPLYVDVTARPSLTTVDGDVRYVVTTSNPMTGCTMPNYAYEWSSELGGLENVPNSAEQTMDYKEPGLKVVFVAVVGTAGLEGVGFDIVQVE